VEARRAIIMLNFRWIYGQSGYALIAHTRIADGLMGTNGDRTNKFGISIHLNVASYLMVAGGTQNFLI
jgi:hypothetical protein